MGVRVACATLQMDEPLAAVIFSGALERHPRLKIVIAETGIGWLPYMLERMDDTYRKFLDAGEFWRTHGGLRLTMPPSAYFRRQVWATFQTDLVGLRLVDMLGEDRVMWASDYPHADSTWPDSQQAIEENFNGVAPAARPPDPLRQREGALRVVGRSGSRLEVTDPQQCAAGRSAGAPVPGVELLADHAADASPRRGHDPPPAKPHAGDPAHEERRPSEPIDTPRGVGTPAPCA